MCECLFSFLDYIELSLIFISNEFIQLVLDICYQASDMTNTVQTIEQRTKCTLYHVYNKDSFYYSHVPLTNEQLSHYNCFREPQSNFQDMLEQNGSMLLIVYSICNVFCFLQMQYYQFKRENDKTQLWAYVFLNLLRIIKSQSYNQYFSYDCSEICITLTGENLTKYEIYGQFFALLSVFLYLFSVCAKNSERTNINILLAFIFFSDLSISFYSFSFSKLGSYTLPIAISGFLIVLKGLCFFAKLNRQKNQLESW